MPTKTGEILRAAANKSGFTAEGSAENKGPGNPVPVTSGLNKHSQNTENKQDTLLYQKFTNSLLVDSLSSQLLNSPDKQRNTLSIQTKGKTGLYTRFC
jgi:hypothetical protein